MLPDGAAGFPFSMAPPGVPSRTRSPALAAWQSSNAIGIPGQGAQNIRRPHGSLLDQGSIPRSA
jgi:hypothetical protein